MLSGSALTAEIPTPTSLSTPNRAAPANSSRQREKCHMIAVGDRLLFVCCCFVVVAGVIVVVFLSLTFSLFMQVFLYVTP